MAPGRFVAAEWEKNIFLFFCIPIVFFSRPSRFLDLFNVFRSKTASFVVSVCALHSFAERAINFLQNRILQMRELSRCKISSCQTFSSAFRQSQFIFGKFQILPITWFIVINFYLRKVRGWSGKKVRLHPSWKKSPQITAEGLDWENKLQRVNFEEFREIALRELHFYTL